MLSSRLHDNCISPARQMDSNGVPLPPGYQQSPPVDTPPKQRNPDVLLGEFVGVPPPGIQLPTVDELLKLCPEGHPRQHLAYPPDSPVFWVKYGTSVYWNEIAALSVAHRELRNLGSAVRAPAVYYGFQFGWRTFVVMEFISGKTVGQCLKEVEEAGKEKLMDQVALSLSELHRIPVSRGTRPSAIDGGLARHKLFDELEAPRHYEDVDQLEENLNLVVPRNNEKEARVKDLSREPMVFCQSDIYPENFMIDHQGHIVVINMSEVSFLPSSFATYALLDHRFDIEFRDRVYVPRTDGVDNTTALCAALGPMVMGPAGFSSTGRRAAGGDKDTQIRIMRSIEAKGYGGPY